jgi:hypothetical protein
VESYRAKPSHSAQVGRFSSPSELALGSTSGSCACHLSEIHGRNPRAESELDRLDEGVGEHGIAGPRRMHGVEREETAEEIGREPAVACHDAARRRALEQAVNVDERRSPCKRLQGDDEIELSRRGADRGDLSGVEHDVPRQRARHRARKDEADELEGVGRHEVAVRQAEDGADDRER